MQDQMTAICIKELPSRQYGTVDLANLNGPLSHSRAETMEANRHRSARIQNIMFRLKGAVRNKINTWFNAKQDVGIREEVFLYIAWKYGLLDPPITNLNLVVEMLQLVWEFARKPRPPANTAMPHVLKMTRKIWPKSLDVNFHNQCCSAKMEPTCYQVHWYLFHSVVTATGYLPPRQSSSFSLGVPRREAERQMAAYQAVVLSNLLTMEGPTADIIDEMNQVLQDPHATPLPHSSTDRVYQDVMKRLDHVYRTNVECRNKQRIHAAKQRAAASFQHSGMENNGTYYSSAAPFQTAVVDAVSGVIEPPYQQPSPPVAPAKYSIEEEQALYNQPSQPEKVEQKKEQSIARIKSQKRKNRTRQVTRMLEKALDTMRVQTTDAGTQTEDTVTLSHEQFLTWDEGLRKNAKFLSNHSSFWSNLLKEYTRAGTS